MGRAVSTLSNQNDHLHPSHTLTILKRSIMKTSKSPVSKQVVAAKLLSIIFLITITLGCNKRPCDSCEFTANPESGTVATDWYKLQIRILLNANPATNNATNFDNFVAGLAFRRI